MTIRLATVIAVLLISLPTAVMADDFYVITGTYKAQRKAQEIAALKGGWVLNTNFYPNLTPNLFVIVRGPFRTKAEAAERLERLVKGGRYPGSYVKNAGTINLNANIGAKKLTPQMIAALLGEILIEVGESKGGSHPCEPQEPYSQLTLSYISVVIDWGAKNQRMLYQPKSVPIDVGAFRRIKSSGQIERMRICVE